MPRDVIRFDEEPVLVKLDFAEGIQVEGQYGVDWQYRVNDSAAVIYLPKEGRDALKDCGAKAGDNVAIRKYKRGKMWVWDIERVTESKSAPQATPQPESSRALPSEAQPVFQQLASVLCAAIDAVSEAQKYAAGKNLPLQFSADDVRAIALSVYIGNQRNGNGAHK